MGLSAIPRDRSASGSPDVSAALASLLASRGIRDCLQWFQRERKWINERHLELCRIAAPTFFEQKRAEWMAAQFRALGWETQIDKVGNVVAFSHASRLPPAVAATAHLDTVLAPRTQDDIYVGPDGSFHGPGVSDNGAGLAALLAVAAAWKNCLNQEDAAPVVLVANVGEEGEGNLSGMRYLCNQSALARKIGAFIVLDGPNTDHITSQALASRRYDISFAGPGGHSWSDYGTGNPIHAISRAISLFADQTNAPPTDAPRYSYNFGLIEGGSSVNSIPSSARAKIDLRSENPAKIVELTDLLTTCVERALETENQRSSGSRLTAKIKEIGSRPGGQLPPDAPILDVIRAVDTHLGIRSQIDCASTDANIPLSIGLPAVSIGSGGQGGGAHTGSEWFHPEGREFGLQRILLALSVLRARADQARPAE